MSRTLPTRVLLIRHGEKSDDKTDAHLSPAGQERARRLAATLPSMYPDLSVIFAAAPSKESNRSVETVTPLADALHITIDDSFADKEHKALAAQILSDPADYAGKTLLIAWHHEKIPALARNLGAEGAPDTWADADFDAIWEIAYAEDGRATFASRSLLGRLPG